MAYTEFYVQPTGSNLNAGSTSTDAATKAYTGGDWDATNDIFTAAVGADMTEAVVGRFIALFVDGDTAPTANQFTVRRITAVNAGNRTITAPITNGVNLGTELANQTATCSARIGGAWAGPSGASGFPFNAFLSGVLVNTNNDPTRINIKGGSTYEITAGMTHSTNGVIFEGYTTTPGDGGLAKFGGDSAASDTPYTMLTVSGAGNKFYRLWFDDNGGITGGQTVGNNAMFDITSNGNHAQYCRFTNAYRVGARCGGAGSMISDCEAYSNNRDDASGFGGIHVTASGQISRCIAYNHAAGTDSCGFSASANDDRVMGFEDCISFNNAGNGFEFTGSDCSIRMKGCLVVDNAENGVEFNASTATTSLAIMEDCVIYGSGLFGIRNANAIRCSPNVINCAFAENDSGVSSNVPSSFLVNAITLSADPFTAKATGNFTLNSAAGGGALLRAAAVRAFFINTANLAAAGSTVDTRNVGALQEEGGDSPVVAGGGSNHVPDFSL